VLAEEESCDGRRDTKKAISEELKDGDRGDFLEIQGLFPPLRPTIHDPFPSPSPINSKNNAHGSRGTLTILDSTQDSHKS